MVKRLALYLAGLACAAQAQSTIYRTVEELWRGYDPRALTLDAETVAEERSGDQIIRKIYFTAEVADGFKVRVFAYYGFPAGAKKLPAILHIHGGGQNATKDYVGYWAKRGFATLSINWGGIPQSTAETTDWGPLDAYQLGKTNTYRTKPDTRADSWYHWTIACRRGLTFLEQQPEVDAASIGVFGVSMGGRLTWLVAGIDERVKAAASVYGAVSMQKEIAGHPHSEQLRFDTADEAAIWAGSLDSMAYAPRIRIPFLFLGASDDFYGAMDFVDEAIGKIPGASKWQTFSPHFNHHVAVEQAAALPRWMDWHLKKGQPFPDSPVLTVEFKAGAPKAMVRDPAGRMQKVDVYYSADPYPQSRFWHTAEASRHGSGWTARLSLPQGTGPFRTFANIGYRDGLSLSSRLVTIERATSKHPVKSSLIIDDFSAGSRDWFIPAAGPNLLLSKAEPIQSIKDDAGRPAIALGNVSRWAIATRKTGDPEWTGPAGAGLRFVVRAQTANHFLVIATENEFRRDRRTRVFLSPVAVEGGDRWQTVTLRLSDFKLAEGEERLNSWQDVNLLSMQPQYSTRDTSKYPFVIHSIGEVWQGPAPAFGRIEWVP